VHLELSVRTHNITCTFNFYFKAVLSTFLNITSKVVTDYNIFNSDGYTRLFAYVGILYYNFGSS